MKYVKTSRVVCAIAALLAIVLWTRPAAAQNVTTGALNGVATDAQGGVLPGVSVSAVHEPTGTKYEAVTGSDGRFQIPNVRVGGPYSLTAMLSGFKEQKIPNVTVLLGEEKTIDFKLSIASLTESVTVIAQSPAIDGTRAGTAANVSTAALEELPTIARDISDFARTSPYFNQSNTNGGANYLTVAGQNNRYNNVQIDGAVNNDLFGLADNGFPGGQTGTQPISLDALQELQLVVAPYDVRQGGFAGGGINAITRSGSNRLGGTAYMFGRNEKLVGAIPGQLDPSGPTKKIGTFKDQQGGASLGGPIAQNKAFFFGNLDLGRRTTPTGFSLDGASGQAFGHQADAQRLLSILQNQYGYNPGGLGEFSARGNSDKVFVRTDFNLSSKNQLVIRHNYIKGLADTGGQSNTGYGMPDNFPQIVDKTNSTVGQLNSSLGSAYNEFRATYTRERNVRTGQPGQPRFPFIRVDFADGTDITAGTENFSSANQLDQDTLELTDDVTWLRGKHTVTVGTHNELFKFRNLFIRDNFGNYRFNGLDNFAAGLAGGYSYSFSATSDPQQAARFAVHQFGFYAGDQWRAASNFTLTYGFRVDVPNFPDTPHANPLAVADFGYRTDVVPAPKMYSPRAGFNWDLSHGSDRRQQVRGGLGYFTGRTPYVWLSNQYGNTGIDFTRISVNYNRNRPIIPFVANPDAQPKTIPGAAVAFNEIDAIDPQYKFPTLVRGNLAYDKDLGFWGLIGTAEVLFSTTVKDIKYQNLNYAITGSAPDGRPTYSKVVPTLSDVILLTNTNQGSKWSVSAKVDRPFKNGFLFSGSYIYGRATSIMDGTSSQAASNWGNVYVGGDVNNPPLTTSNFDLRHRVSLSGTMPIPLGKGFRSTASFYYNGQSGQPYVLVFNGDANGDNRFFNDILSVPANATDVVVKNGTFPQLQAYLNGDDSAKNAAGTIPPRNNARAPWVNSLDFRYAVDVPTGSRAKVELTMDVLNLLNLFGNTHGWRLYPNFNSPSPVVYGGIDKATGKQIFDLSPLNATTDAGVRTFSTFNRDDLRSRWQAQWGLRVRF